MLSKFLFAFSCWLFLGETVVYLSKECLNGEFVTGTSCQIEIVLTQSTKFFVKYDLRALLRIQTLLLIVFGQPPENTRHSSKA